MITCPSCNTQNEDSAEFCVTCGTRLRAAAQPESAVSCPSCGTLLFEVCPSCHQIRHGLLGYCEHCGAEKEVAAGAGNLS